VFLRPEEEKGRQVRRRSNGEEKKNDRYRWREETLQLAALGEQRGVGKEGRRGTEDHWRKKGFVRKGELNSRSMRNIRKKRKLCTREREWSSVHGGKKRKRLVKGPVSRQEEGGEEYLLHSREFWDGGGGVIMGVGLETLPSESDTSVSFLQMGGGGLRQGKKGRAAQGGGTQSCGTYESDLVLAGGERSQN